MEKQLKIVDENFLVDFNDLIGKGQYGQVYRAYDLLNEEDDICVKVINLSKFVTRSDNLKNIHRELEAMRTLKNCKHPNVVTLTHDFVSKNNLYMFMEYCKEGTLENIIEKRKVLSMLKQISEAFVYINQNNIIHRDLKPANILISNNLYKIADFGFARIIDNFETLTSVTKLGTPLFMSPLMLTESKTIEGKCDVWSLGVVAYELLFGRNPFYCNNMKDLLTKIVFFLN